MTKALQNILFLAIFIFLIFIKTVNAEPIFHEKYYPSGNGPFPVVIALHTSSGYFSVR